jgi:hypothetical protein
MLAFVASDLPAHQPPDESVEELIRRADVAGERVTKDQLRRWHGRDLLPKPRQESRGRKGSEVFYPAGTGDQLLALLELKHRYPKSLAKIGWGLWWHGFPVPDALARTFMLALLHRNARLMEQLITPEGEPTEKFEDALDDAHLAKLDSGTIRRARRRVGVNDFGIFMESLLQVGSGNTEMLKDEDLEMLEHGMAIDRARIDKLPSTGKPWLEGNDIRTDFERIGAFSDPARQEAVLAATSDEHLRRARETVRLFLPTIVNTGTVLGDLFGSRAFGYAAFAKDFGELDDSPEGQAFFIVVVLTVGAAGFDQGIESTTDQYLESERKRAEHELLAALRDAIPELQSIISNRRLVAADRDPIKAGQLQRDIAEVRAELSSEMDAFFNEFFDSHPRHRELLRPGE